MFDDISSVEAGRTLVADMIVTVIELRNLALVEGASALWAEALESWGQLEDMLVDAYVEFVFDPLKGVASLIDQVVNDFFNAAYGWRQPRYDPLTLDLDGDGLETVGINAGNPILFDHDGDGIKTGTGWVKPDDGFLVLDRNGNGTIDSGRELFGDSTLLPGGGTAADGFAALVEEDTNADGRVDALDARFGELRIWRDLNQNGISEAGELSTLEAAGIVAIRTAKTEHSATLANGNQIADKGTFVRADGTEGDLVEVTGDLADINLANNPFYSEFTDAVRYFQEAANNGAWARVA